MTRFLHVANGTSVTNTLAETGIPGSLSIWADPLYEGPVPAGLSDDELVEVRTRYLLGTDDPHEDRTNDLRRWREALDDHRSYDELVLWFEHDLFDQLNLIQLLTYLRSRPPVGKTVSLICIGSFPGRPDFHGLGELSASELTSLFDTRRPVHDDEYVLAGRAWRAFREPTPESFDQLRHSDTQALPFLARAVRRFLEEYPSTRNGLTRSEHRLLEIADGGIRLWTGFRRMHTGEEAYYIGDLSFKRLVEELAATSPPLLLIEDGSFSLTAEGREVLAARKDRVSYGLDRWMGGVHLQTGKTPIWRWSGSNLLAT